MTEAQLAVLSTKLDAVLAQEARNAKTLQEIQAWQIAHDLNHARGDRDGSSGNRLVPVLVDVVKMLAAALVSLFGYSQFVQNHVR